MRHPTRPHPLLLALVAGAIAAGPGCELPDPEHDGGELAHTVAPQESEGDFFWVRGVVRVASDGCDGAVPTLRPPGDFSGDAEFQLVGSDLDLAPVPLTYGDVAPDGSRPIAALLQRTGDDGELLSWALHKPSLTRLRYGSETGEGHARALFTRPSNLTAPAEGDVEGWDLDYTDLASVTVVLEMLPPPGEALTPDDDIVSVFALFRADPIDERRGGFFASSVCHGDGCGSYGPGASPRTVAGFVREYTLDADGAVIGQRAMAELLLPAGRALYEVRLEIRLRDGMLYRQFDSTGLPADALTPCGELTLGSAQGNCDACDFARPPQAVEGTTFLASEYSADPSMGGPRPTGYRVNLINAQDSTVITGFNAGGGLASPWPTDGLLPEPYAWRGIIEGRYRVHHVTGLRADHRQVRSHVRLGWGEPGEPGYRPTPSDPGFMTLRPMLRWPRVGAIHLPDGAGGLVRGDGPDGPYRDGHFYLDPGETEELHLHGEGAYLGGVVEPLGCDLGPGNIAAGYADFEGVGSASGGGTFVDERGVERDVPSGNYLGFARGLFGAGTGDYEVLAIPGPWQESAYRLELDGLGDEPYQGTLFVWPAEARAVELTAGRANQTTLPPIPLAVTRVGLSLTAPGRLIRNQRLRVGLDCCQNDDYAGRVPYHDAAGAVIGHFTATAQGASVVAMANSAVTLSATAEVSEDGGATWVETSFPSIPGVELTDACGACVVPGAEPGDPPILLEDEDGPPILDVDPVADQPLGTTEVTINGVATDDTPIRDIFIDGVAVDFTLVETEDGYLATFSAPAAAVPGNNTVTVEAVDCLGNTSTVIITFYVDEPLCLPEDEIPPECHPDQGGVVFYVEVLDQGQPRAIRCVAWPDAAPTCDTANLFDPVCAD